MYGFDLSQWHDEQKWSVAHIPKTSNILHGSKDKEIQRKQNPLHVSALHNRHWDIVANTVTRLWPKD